MQKYLLNLNDDDPIDELETRRPTPIEFEKQALRFLKSMQHEQKNI
jgi:hypothetical protein